MTTFDDNNNTDEDDDDDDGNYVPNAKKELDFSDDEEFLAAATRAVRLMKAKASEIVLNYSVWFVREQFV